MKSFYYILMFLGVPLWLSAQTTGQNYIIATTPFLPVTDPTALVDVNTTANSNSTIQYFDGLGRPVETVQNALSSKDGTTWVDLVNVTQYDAFGREYKHWLPAPATGSTGAFVDSTGYAGLSSTQYPGGEKPYSTTEFEASPLNRVTGQFGAGKDWYDANKKINTAYQANDANEVIYFSVENDQLKRNGNYDPGTLYKTVVTDEDGKPSTEYKDKQGQVVLKRNEEGGHLDTYFVYNDLGQLSYVIPPKAVDELTDFSDDNVIMKQYCYLYKYDERGNNIQKRLPGCDYIYMVYDRAYRLVLSQDGNQRAKSPAQWTVTKYDQLGRVIFTGLTNSITASQTDLISTYQNDLIVETFSNGAYTNNKFSDATPLTINYYDTYSFISNSALNYDSSLEQSGYTPQFSSVKGLLTGNRIYHLNDPTKFETTALYYDKYGRVIQTRASNHLGGYDLVYNVLDFTGKPTKTYKTHGISGLSDTYTELYTYTYDKAQRLLTTKLQLKGEVTPTTLVSNSYDELGRLQTKKVGNNIDVTTYSYNIRNWTLGINGGKFTENLYYNTAPTSFTFPTDFAFTPCYNGNIAAMQWNVPSESLGYNRAYAFVYDGMNRLTDANYWGVNSSVVSGTVRKYDEHIGFDKMGNFSSLTRNENGTPLNNLSFAYIGNQMKKVDNSISPFIPYGSEAFNDKRQIDTEYKYDKNGSITYDANNGISTIQYNILNLPDQIQFTEGHKNLYTYDATGKKLEVVNYTVSDIVNVPMDTITVLPSPLRYTKLTTDYVGNMIYENGSLKEILLPEGYYKGGIYYYYLKDHLGDTRVVINNSGSVIEKSHYYPSGMRFFPESTSDSSALAYRYNGKEMEAMNGLNQYDYGARRRGAGLPVWTAVDPLAEKYYSISPYAYCGGNPVNRTDPDGMDWVITTEQKDGKTIYHITVNASLYNNSSTNYSQKQINQLADKIKSESMSAFNTSGKGYSVDFKMNLNVAKSVDNIKSTDHVYQIVDQNVVGAGVNGNSDTNGLNIKLGTTVVNDILDGKNNRTAAHELGHTGGLDDANLNVKQSSQFGVTLNNNLMSQSKYIQDHGGDAINANNLTQGQINYIYNNRNNLNQNSPVTREMTPTNVPMQSYLLLNLHLVPVTTLRK